MHEYKLLSPQPWMSSPTATLLHQPLILSDFIILIFATLMGIKLYLSILISIFLVTLGAEHLFINWLSRFSLLWIAAHILYPFLKLDFSVFVFHQFVGMPCESWVQIASWLYAFSQTVAPFLLLLFAKAFTYIIKYNNVDFTLCPFYEILF